jgi:hypothetical protein
VTLVVITIMIVAVWAINGGLDEIHVTESEPAVVAQ